MAANSSTASLSSRRLRVLVVDDNQDSADSLTLLISCWGHEARTVYGGADALALDPSFRPHVMILDVAMPGMDGNALARRIRQLVGHEDVLLIAATGHGYERDLQDSKDAGFDHVLLKPVQPPVIEKLLAEAQARLEYVGSPV